MSETGIKHDSDKPRPHLLFKSLNRAVMGVLAAIEYGAKKYAPDNHKLVENLEERYMDALERHYLALMSGETHDQESGLPHIDHLITNALIVSEWQKTNG